MEPEPGREDDAALRRRLKQLSSSLDARTAEADAGTESPSTSQAQDSARAMSVGARVLSEFVAAVMVGAGLGWLFDRLVGSSPWGLVVFLMLGMASGLWSVYRIAQSKNDSDEQH